LHLSLPWQEGDDGDPRCVGSHARSTRASHSHPADHGVPQRGDVVDTGEQPVLSSLGGEDDRADRVKVSDLSMRS
jgi:hypothetical protein